LVVEEAYVDRASAIWARYYTRSAPRHGASLVLGLDNNAVTVFSSDNLPLLRPSVTQTPRYGEVGLEKMISPTIWFGLVWCCPACGGLHHWPL